MGNTEMNCPNCNKQLRWLPKGRHTCLCGEVIETDGKDLQEVEIALINVPAKEERSKDADLLLTLAFVFVLSLIAGRIFYHDAMLHVEAGLLEGIFGIDPVGHNQAFAPFIAAGALILWFTVQAVKKLKRKT